MTAASVCPSHASVLRVIPVFGAYVTGVTCPN